MRQDTVERRLDLLKLEGNGLLPAEITKELSVKYDVTRRTVQYDFKHRDRWQPKLQEMEKALLRIVNRHDQLYRKASLNYMQAADAKTKLFAVNLMRTLNKDAFDIMQSTGKIEEVPKKIQSEIKAAIIVKMWKPSDESAK